MKGGYTPGELRLAVRQERAALIAERTEHVKRLSYIDNRLAELDKAENLLEGEI